MGRFGPEFCTHPSKEMGYQLLEDPLFKRKGVINLKTQRNLYLSPEAYVCAKKMLPSGSDYDLFKSDIFSCGLVLLEASILQRVHDIYQVARGKSISQLNLERLIAKMKDYYKGNSLFYSTVERMLRVNPDERPQFGEILSKLPPRSKIGDHFSKKSDQFPQVR